MQLNRFALLLILAILLSKSGGGGRATGQEPAAEPTQEQLQRHQSYYRTLAEVSLRNEKIDEAIGALSESVTVGQMIWQGLLTDETATKDVIDAFGTELIQDYELLSSLLAGKDEFVVASKIELDLLELQIAMYGRDDWRVGNTRRSIQDLLALRTSSDEMRAALRERVPVLSQTLERHRQEGKLEAALTTAEELRQIIQKVWGESHLQYAAVLDSLASIEFERDNIVDAEKHMRDATMIRISVQGFGHPQTYEDLDNLLDELRTLSQIYHGRAIFDGDSSAYTHVQRLRREILDRMKVVTPDDPGITDAELAVQEIDRIVSFGPEVRERYREYELLRNRAGRNKDRAGALADFIAAADMAVELFGEEERMIPALYGTVATLSSMTGDHQQAVKYESKQFEATKALFDKEHPEFRDAGIDFSETLDTVVRLRVADDDMDAAIAAQERSVGVLKEVLDTEHWRLVNARLKLANLNTLNSLTPEERSQIQTALRRPVEDMDGPEKLVKELIPRAQRDCQLLGELLGERDVEVLAANQALGHLFTLAAQYPQAIEVLQACYELRVQVQGKHHPATAECQNALAQIYRTLGDFEHAREEQLQATQTLIDTLGPHDLLTAKSKGQLASIYHQLGGFEPAQDLYHEAFDILADELGLAHDQTQVVGQNLSRLYFDIGDFETSQQYAEQLLAALLNEYGTDAYNRFTTGRVMNLMGDTYRSLGDYVEAEKHFSFARDIVADTMGQDHPEAAQTLHNLGLVYLETGDYARAEAHLTYAARINLNTFGEGHILYGKSLETLGFLMRSLGDFERALAYYGMAWQIYVDSYGGVHADLATLANKISVVYHLKNDKSEALQYNQLSYQINQTILGDDHPRTATARANNAELMLSLGEVDEAEALFSESLLSLERSGGLRTSLGAQTFENLTMAHLMKGDTDAATQSLERALEIRQRAGNENDPHRVSGLLSLAYFDAPPEPLVRQLHAELLKQQRTLELASNIQSEQQQMLSRQFYRSGVDMFLAAAMKVDMSADDIYKVLLPWKGAVFMRQAKLRAVRNMPELADQFAELEKVSHQLSKLLYGNSAGSNSELANEIHRLSLSQEQLEQQISRRSSDFRDQQIATQVTPEELRTSLPMGVTLVDYYAYPHVEIKEKEGKREFGGEIRLIAFVVRRDAPVELIQLGSLAPIEQSLDQWRGQIERGAGDVRGVRVGTENKRADSSTAITNPGTALREALLTPLVKLLADSGPLLISPDDCLGRCPFVALPGLSGDRYLIEERSVALVPVPQRLPAQLARNTEQQAGPYTALLVGDVDFDQVASASEGKQASSSSASAQVPSQLRSANRAGWSQLPATKQELEQLQATLREAVPNAIVHQLTGAQASEFQVRASISKQRIVHLATHGFFAPAEARAALGLSREVVSGGFAAERVGKQSVGFHPGLLTGIVFAGANHEGADGTDDGILTGIEVASLDMRQADLVTLSACETGLGRAAGGEGVLGLQRAFQMGGAKSTVTSLWQVEDRATRALMVEFYENLWKRKQPVAEALRQAQLAMIHRYDVRQGVIAESDKDEDESESSTLAPKYWAPFVVSGDWR